MSARDGGDHDEATLRRRGSQQPKKGDFDLWKGQSRPRSASLVNTKGEIVNVEDSSFWSHRWFHGRITRSTVGAGAGTRAAASPPPRPQPPYFRPLPRARCDCGEGARRQDHG